IGATLIVGNVALFGVVRAAEITHGTVMYAQPVFGLFPRGAFSRQPLPAFKLEAPVTVRLFSSERLQTLWLRNAAGFLVSDHQLKSPIFIGKEGNILSIFVHGRRTFQGRELTIRSLNNQPFELLTRQGAIKRTRGELKIRIVKNQMVVANRLEIEDYVS